MLEPTIRQKVGAIAAFRLLELQGEIKVGNRAQYLQAKRWASELGIDWVFDPYNFNVDRVTARVSER